jgi:DNA-binding protein HU-beta
MDMNKMELVSAVGDRAFLTRAAANAAVDAVFDIVSEAIADGDEVNIKGFGAFSAAARPERDGRNPKTGERLRIAASRVPQFRAHKSLKNFVNGNPGANGDGETNGDEAEEPDAGDHANEDRAK